MRVHQEILSLRGKPRGLYDFTEQLAAVVQHSLVRTGL